MVVRGAKAILAKVPQGYGMTKGEAANYARAVIEALMQPTKPMVFYGMDAMARDGLEPTEDEFRAGFVAALRSILSQPNEGEGE